MNIYGFDYQSYKLRNLDEIINESKYYDPEKTEGQSLLTPPQKIHLYEKIIKYPFKCDGQPIQFMLSMVTEGLTPPINKCMQIESENGIKIGVFIQDSIVTTLKRNTK
jgi:hypothetical protein